MSSRARNQAKVVFAVMGATGTGKSTFIRLLTNDDTIKVGHNQESETSDIQSASYIDKATGHLVTLIDTPGFDDSRDGVTDTDILQKMVEYLEPEGGKSRKLNGIVYLHRISDPRVGGVSRKNLRMFHKLCGDKNLANVRIITTNWSRVTEQEGNFRETDLKNGAFKALIDAGAQMRRYINTIESASHIMSELIPLPEITTAIQDEIRDGKKLADTGAGMVLTEAMREMQKRHEKEMANLRKELEAAAKKSNEALRAQLELERKTLEEKIQRVEDDRVKLARTLEEQREAERKEREEENAARARQKEKWNEERRKLSAQVEAARENAARLEKDTAKRQAELERQIADASRKAQDNERAAAKAEYERQARQWTSERNKMADELAAARKNATQVAGTAAKRQSELAREIAEANERIEKLSNRSRCLIC